MAESISTRADRLFATASGLTREDSQAILAEHSANGRLRSGATIIRVTEAFADRSREALDEALSSVSGQVDHRGRKWRSMIVLVDEAIDRHMDAAPPVVAEFTRVAGANHEALAAPTLAKLRADLHARLVDYREGWTAPRAKPWRERNALVYALLLLVAGAAVSEGAKWLFSKLEQKTIAPLSAATAPPAIKTQH
jgi:hypothetical protein